MRSLLRAPGILKEPARSTFSHLKKTEYPVASSNERQVMTGGRWIRSRRRPAAARTSSRGITSLRGLAGLGGRRWLERRGGGVKVGVESAKDHFDPSGTVDVLAHEPAVHGSRVKGRRVGRHVFGSHDVLHSTPSFLSRSISADARPSRSHSTSSVCWPSSGGGLVISPGVSENFTGTPTSLTFPAVGWTISWTIPRWST